MAHGAPADTCTERDSCPWDAGQCGQNIVLSFTGLSGTGWTNNSIDCSHAETFKMQTIPGPASQPDWSGALLTLVSDAWPVCHQQTKTPPGTPHT